MRFGDAEIRRRALPISVSAYRSMSERGLVGKRAELIRGVIVEKRPKSPLHEILASGIYERSTAHVVIEVAVTSEVLDHEKASLYAEAGIGEYWLLIASERAVEIHTGAQNGQWTSIRRVPPRHSKRRLLFPKYGSRGLSSFRADPR